MATKKTEYKYNPKSGKWESVYVTTTSSSGGGSNKSKDIANDSTVSGTTSASKVDSQSSATKEAAEIEYDTLEGDAVVLPMPTTMQLKVNQTVKVVGIGNKLSGLFFISKIKRTLSESGYSQTVTLIRTDFTNLDKSVSGNTGSATQNKTSVFAVGNKVKFCSDNAVYSNAHDGVRVPEWVKQKTHTVDAVSADGNRVRLKEIWSWTYVKYLKKV